MHAKIAAGDTIDAHWDRNKTISELYRDPATHRWQHAHGPLTAYMAACNGPCDKVDVNDGAKRWFKIADTPLPKGKLASDPLAWEQTNLCDGLPWTVTIPKRLKPGFYLIRHEVIAIHIVPTQFYPECAQLEVTGDGKDLPAASDLVAFPGAYDPAGGYFLNIWLDIS